MMNLSKIMKRAWEIKKEEDLKTKNRKMIHNDFSELKDCEKAVFSICLSMAWEEAKKEAKEQAKRDSFKRTENVATIKDWFYNKKFGNNDCFSKNILIEKETDKAVFGKVECDMYGEAGIVEIWVPKSCLC